MQDFLSNFELFKTIANDNPNLVIDNKSLLVHSTEVEQIKYLLSTGKLDLTLKENQKVVRYSSTEKILALIDAGFDMTIKNSNDQWERTFLFYIKSSELVLPLLEKGLDINYKDIYGCSVLYYHCIGDYNENNGKLIECLIQNGANINETYEDKSLLNVMIEYKYYAFADLLIKYNKKLLYSEKDNLRNFIRRDMLESNEIYFE